ncbi:cell division topological specificity factor MinE [Sulfurivirga caldicuralii]|uniref:Cell division topological specificity factor n=1 Tax=Sulfurivirga caldicuralii TaxID=364032 RepID=A0A1N6F7H1_9GAMM|nr:cell division topological specificity factor MinE [Sulfurivirga caldicuralii]SIN91221.1 cell division topological specificity factor MinE [Sulfurivirga caldicuralii]
MSVLDYFLGKRQKKSARVAKERLQLVMVHERNARNAPDFLPQMREEILAVISKYVEIDREQLQINLDHADGYEVLELNVVIPEKEA